jgi:hypothetical protein
LRINRARDDAAGLSIANAFKNIGFSAAAIGTALTQAMVDGVPANPISVKREFTLDSSTDPTGLNTRLAMSMNWHLTCLPRAAMFKMLTEKRHAISLKK